MDIYILHFDTSNIEPKILEKFCHKSFKNRQKQLEHAFLYFMLDKILNEKYGVQDRILEFIDGKPFLNTRKLYFSLSHSGDFVVIAISKNNCGVDIEKIKVRDYKTISERMGFECASLKEFYKEWTKYEANFKLGSKYKSTKTAELENYVLTAVSENNDEEFQFYIQIREEFSKLTV